MQKYFKIIEEMKSGRCLLIDGATATEMERRGVPQLMNAWNGGGSMTHPKILKDIHKSYLASGAKVIITNTFRFANIPFRKRKRLTILMS